jgi:serine/threonine protein kinase
LAPAFARGLQAFKDEARLFMGVSHPGLVKVQQLCEQGGTAYVVMPWLSGMVLQEWLAELGTPPSEAWLRDLLRPLMQALEALHRRGGYHGGLSLHSIWLQFENKAESYLSQQSQPLLLGCGAATRVLRQANVDFQASSGSHGYGPVEQFDGDIHARKGAWTDVYGLCAVTYAALFGRPPPSSMARMARDELVSARKLGRGRYGAALLAAIDAGLVVRPQHRVQSIAALRQLMDGDPPLQKLRPGAARAVQDNDAAAAPVAVWDDRQPDPAVWPPPPPWLGLAGPWWAWSAGLGVLLLATALLGYLLQD